VGSNPTPGAFNIVLDEPPWWGYFGFLKIFGVVEVADVAEICFWDKLASLKRICGFPMQTRTCLFWKKEG
jgi:hypothetical protein